MMGECQFDQFVKIEYVDLIKGLDLEELFVPFDEVEGFGEPEAEGEVAAIAVNLTRDDEPVGHVLGAEAQACQDCAWISRLERIEGSMWTTTCVLRSGSPVVRA